MKTFLRNSRFLIFVFLITNLFFASGVYSQTVSTDLLDYTPGSTAIITGSGFQAGETVTLLVEHAGEEPAGTDPQYHQPWTVVADGLGSFTSSWYVPTVAQGDALGATLLLTADGATSLLHAEWTFTDGSSIAATWTLTTLTISSSSDGLVSSKTYRIDFVDPTGAVSSSSNFSGGVAQPYVVNKILSAGYPTGNWTIRLMIEGSGSNSGTFSSDKETTVSVTAPSCTAPVVTNMTAAAICSSNNFTAIPVNGTNGTVPSGTTYSWNAPIVSGISGTVGGTDVANISGTLTNSTNAPINVVYSVTPKSGTCTGSIFTVTVSVKPTPTVTNLPLSQTICSGGNTSLVTLNSSVIGTTFAWTATATAGVSGYATNGTGTIPSQTISTTGTTQGAVTYAITPTANGCVGAVTNYTVLVNIPTQATFNSSPVDITIACGTPQALSSLSYTNGESGNCLISGSVTSTQTVQYPAGACGGTITETWSFTDVQNRTITKKRTITVNPATLPTMTAPGPITVACGALPSASTISFSNGLSGGCLISGTSNPSTFSATPDACGGAVTETWTATDACGRTVASVSRTITISPADLPTMTAPANTTVACGALPSASTISFSNGLSGGCLISGTSNPSTFSATPDACGGAVTETWTATDACGRTVASVSRTITISPADLPTMTAPANTTVACGALPSASTISFSNGLSGGCLISGTSNPSTFSATPDACGGAVTETWTAIDSCGRTVASVSRTITISPADLPTMTAPANTTVACGALPSASTISFSNGLSGGCLISGTSNPSTFSATPDACGGAVTETWTATDACGRTVASVSRTITISPADLPTMTAPANTTVACGALPSASTISFSNGLSGGGLISGTSNPSTFSATPDACGGAVTETWTATDACGRTVASVSRTITISPADLPTMTAPANTTVACGALPSASTISFSNGLSGGCLISGTSNPSTFSATPDACGGAVTETWTAIDSCGRTVASVSRTITISPADLPTMTAPANTTVACGALPSASTISFSNGLSGGCLISGTSNPSTFSATPDACGGAVIETWTATDACGRTVASVSRTITISPADLPRMTAPANTTVACGALPSASTISFSNGLSGGCLISGTSNPSTFSATPDACGGAVIETWTATDACGRTVASVSRTITISPADLPRMTAPANTTVACGALPSASTISFSNGLSGGCLISGTSNPSTFSATPDACGGAVTETWTATDACGRTVASVSRTITISPADLPTMTAPANTTVACGALPSASTISFSNGLSGGCLISGTSNPSTFSATPDACGGAVTETWTATDACGRTVASVSRTITISPADLPTMTAPATITVACGALPSASTISFSNGLSGGCLISGTSNPSTFSATPDACGGAVTETWTATDACGRTVASVSRTITISPADLPTMTAPANTTVACGALPSASTISFSNGLSGGCLISGTSNPSTFSATPDACGGAVTETWTAIDSCGRTVASVSRTITISPADLPRMTAPTNTTVACGALPSASTISFSNGLSGGCLISGTSNPSTFSATPDACGGAVTETWTATDACGRTVASVSRTITISPADLPTMTAPANTTVACGALPSASTISFSNGLSGGCLISGTSNPSTFSATPDACGGAVTETWTATDACGRTVASVSRTIIVSPADLPTMTAPAAITVACGALPSASTISFSNGLSGGCLISGTSNPSTFSATPDACGGAVTETWTATDACGRTVASVSRTITISPADLPTITAPANISISCISQLPAPSTRLFSNGLSGGCLISGSSNASTFTSAPACDGIITETWTATDNCDRALAQVSRTITLARIGVPNISNCPANIIVNTGVGKTTCNQIATWTAPTAITSCGEVANVSSSHNPGDTFIVGTTTVTYTFTDCASNTSTCTFTVTVIDNTKPVISTNENKNVNSDANICGATVTVSATASDNCGVGTPSGVRSDNLGLNAIYPVGVTTIIWNVNDINGNPALTVNQTVTVTDNQVPTITICPSNKTGVSTNFEGCTYKHSGTGWDAVAADNCAVASIKYTLSGSSAVYTSLNAVVFNSGVTTVTAIAYDGAGNVSAPCSFTVTVASTLSATITPTKKYVYFGAPGDQTATITASPSGGTAPYTVKITMLTDTTAPVDPAAVRVDGKLICGFITTTGNEVWSSANANSSTGITCATNTVTASSTLTSVPINGSYSVTVTLLANAKFVATVTDAIGCSYTIPYGQAAHVVAEDARCFAGKSGNAKVKICHQTGNAKNPCTEICVDDSAVAAHLAHGDFLGKCSSNCVNPATLTKPVVIGKQEIIDLAEFDVKAYPNPSNHQFTIAVQGSSDEKVEVFVYDMLARMIKKIEKPNAQNILLGEELPSGEYLLLIRQGSNQKAINVIKK